MHTESDTTAAVRGTSDPRITEARRLVARTQDALHRAARAGTLTDKTGYAILAHRDRIGPNAALPAAAALIYYARAAVQAAERATARPEPIPDCNNQWALPGLLSCEQQRLADLEAECAIELAEQLTDGPWPIC